MQLVRRTPVPMLLILDGFSEASSHQLALLKVLVWAILRLEMLSYSKS